MKIQNAKRWSRYSTGQAAALTAIITLFTFVVRYLLQPYIEPFGVFHFFIISTLVIEFLFGYQFAIPAMLCSLLLGEVFFVKPYGEISNLTTKDLIIGLNFIAVALAAICLIEYLQRSLYAKKLLLKVNDSRQMILLLRENDRLYYSRRNDIASRALFKILSDFEKILFLQHGEKPIVPGPAFLKELEMPCASTASWSDCIHPEDFSKLTQKLNFSLKSEKEHRETFSLRFHHAGVEKEIIGTALKYALDSEIVQVWLMHVTD